MEHLKKYKIEDESFDENDNINNNNNINTDNELEKEMNIQNKQTCNSLQNNINENSSYQNNNNLNFNTSQIKSNSNKNNININNLNQSEMNFTNMDDLLQNSHEENFHHVQIIDEDVENFKRRLDIMLRNFRTDTLKDFMAIKRNLLTEQKNAIENEKQKCDALISSKSDLIEHLKDDLALTQKNLNNQINIKENLVNLIFNQKKNKYTK